VAAALGEKRLKGEFNEGAGRKQLFSFFPSREFLLRVFDFSPGLT
jgi:hypothetical protein